MSADQFETLKAVQNSTNLRKHESEFEKKYANWIKEMNQDFESTGHWCEDLRVWFMIHQKTPRILLNAACHLVRLRISNGTAQCLERICARITPNADS